MQSSSHRDNDQLLEGVGTLKLSPHFSFSDGVAAQGEGPNEDLERS